MRVHFLLLLVLLAGARGALAQQTAPPVRAIEEEQWEKATDGMDYSRDWPRPEEQRQLPDMTLPESDNGWTAGTLNWGIVGQVFAVLLGVLALGYAIYRMMQQPRGKVIAQDGVEITAANLEEYLHETELDRFLREALAAGNYALAIRIYYLEVIKTLSTKKLITWSREKTNREYVREMRPHPLGGQFREVTNLYEQVWYGNRPVSREDFNRMEPDFQKVIRP